MSRRCTRRLSQLVLLDSIVASLGSFDMFDAATTRVSRTCENSSHRRRERKKYRLFDELVEEKNDTAVVLSLFITARSFLVP